MERGKSSARFDRLREQNQLVAYLGGCRGGILPVGSRIKDVVFNEPEFLVRVASMGRVRYHAVLAYIEIGADDVPTGSISSHISSLPDKALLHRVIQYYEASVELHPALVTILRKADFGLRARAIGEINRLLGQGANHGAILKAARGGQLNRPVLMPDRRLHPATVSCAHLFIGERARQLLAFDRLVQIASARTNGAIPCVKRLRRVADFDQFEADLEAQFSRYKGLVPVPEINHPRLKLARSVPQLRAMGESMQNCLAASQIHHHRKLVLGMCQFGLYSNEAERILIRFSRNSEGDFEVIEASGYGNFEVDPEALAVALDDLSSAGHTWRLSTAYACSILQLAGTWGEI